MQNRLSHDIAVQALAFAVKGGLSLFALGVITNLSNASDIIEYGFAWAVASPLCVINSAIIANPIVLTTSNSIRCTQLRRLYRYLIMILGCQCAALVTASCVLNFDFQNYRWANALLLAAIFVPLTSIGAIEIAVAQKAKKFQRLSASTSAGAIFAVGAAFAISVFSKPAALLAIHGAAGIFIFIFLRLSRHKNELSSELDSEQKDGGHFVKGLHLALSSGTAALLINLPQVLLSRYYSEEAVSVFIIARRLLEILSVQVSSVANSVILPHMVHAINTNQAVSEIFLNANRMVLVVMSAALVLLGASPGTTLETFSGFSTDTSADIFFALIFLQLGLLPGLSVFPAYQALGYLAVPWIWNIFLMVFQSIIIVGGSDADFLSVIYILSASTWLILSAVLPAILLMGISVGRWIFHVAPIMIAAILALLLLRALESYMNSYIHMVLLAVLIAASFMGFLMPIKIKLPFKNTQDAY